MMLPVMEGDKELEEGDKELEEGEINEMSESEKDDHALDSTNYLPGLENGTVPEDTEDTILIKHKMAGVISQMVNQSVVLDDYRLKPTFTSPNPETSYVRTFNNPIEYKLNSTISKFGEQNNSGRVKTEPGHDNGEVEDIDVLLTRHELLCQQLEKVEGATVKKKMGKHPKKVERKNRRKQRKKENLEIMKKGLPSSAIIVPSSEEEPMSHKIPLAKFLDQRFSTPFSTVGSIPFKSTHTNDGGKALDSALECREGFKKNKSPALSDKSKKGNLSSFSLKERRKKYGSDFLKTHWSPNIKEAFRSSQLKSKRRRLHAYSSDSTDKPSLRNSQFKLDNRKMGANTKVETNKNTPHLEGKGKLSAKQRKRKRLKKEMNERNRNNLVKLKSNPIYHAQQEKEFEILWQQQEEMAYDNYSNVPMEIEDDDVTANAAAPLPLIEMPEIRPPPPPGDEFQPVHDQASLSMTRSNVAWMPGFIESLDPEVHDIPDSSSPGIAESLDPEIHDVPNSSLNFVDLKDTSLGSEQLLSNDIDSISVQVDEDADKDNDEDVWALRAQALKSLACKRAVKAKELHKQKKTKVTDETKSNKDENVTLQLPVSPRTISTLKPAAGKAIVKKRKHCAVVKKPPPKHPPIIIKLSKKDFLSGSESGGQSSEEYPEKKMYIDNYQPKQKLKSRRRKSAGDETLMKELESCSKRCRIRMKKHSSYIVKDQLTYKKLQSEITSQKSLFDKQKANVKRLQEELDLATKQKDATQRAHYQLHEKIKNVKDQLREKIHVRNVTDERILRAKSIISVKRSQPNPSGSSNDRWRDQISTLIESLRESYHGLIKAEKSQDLPLNALHKLSQYCKDENKDISNALDMANMNVRGESQIKLEKYQKICKKALAQIENMPYALWKRDSENTGYDTLKKNEASKKEEVLKKMEEMETNKVMEKKEGISYNLKLANDLLEIKKVFNTLIESPEICPTTYTLLDLLQGVGDVKSLQPVKLHSEESPISQTIESSKILDNSQFQDYKSPLLRFRSYRLDSNFSIHQNLSVDSSTYSNRIRPEMAICQYDLLGTCNDNECSLTHLDEKCSVSLEELIKDLIAYQMHGSDSFRNMESVVKQRNIEKEVKKFMDHYTINPDTPQLLLCKYLNEYFAKRTESVDGIVLSKRDWFSKDHQQIRNRADIIVDHYSTNYDILYFLNPRRKPHSTLNHYNESQEIRYFSGSYDSVALLKNRIAENPSDVKLWLSLVHQILSYADNGCFKKLPHNVREYALSVLSQALEENRYSEELWIQYLKLYSMNHTDVELRELFYQAVMYAANYNVWWTCLSLETSYTGKQEICSEVIKFLLDTDEKNDLKSHYLTEIILYATHLLISCAKIECAEQYLSKALGINCSKVSIEKLNAVDVSNRLSYLDHSLLWLCLISINAFENLPDCIFNIEESGPGRLVKKDKFLLDWQNGSLYSSNDNIRSLFQDSFKLPTEKSSPAVKHLFLLYENAVAFELSLGNVEGGVKILQDLLFENPSLVRGWILLLLLYFQFFPEDEVIDMSEKALVNCHENIQLVYFYSKWLLEKNMRDLSLEKLKRCIENCYFEGKDKNIYSVTEMYKKLIGMPGDPEDLPLEKLQNDISQDDMVCYSLCYCLLLQDQFESQKGSSESYIWQAYEYKIHQYNSLENTKRLWMAYLEFKVKCMSKLRIVTSDEFQAFIDVLFQCLTAVSAVGVVKQDNTLYWKDYEFQNKVIELCMAIIPAHKYSEIYRKMLSYMPDNILLALRICTHEFDCGNLAQARVLCNSLLEVFPRCLPLWKMAIKVEMNCKNVKEVRWLYQEASKALPFCSSLWKNLAKFEVSYASDTEKMNAILDDIIKRATPYGIDLRKLLPKVS